METNSNLTKTIEDDLKANIAEKKGYLAYAKKAEKNAKWIFGLGLMGAAYLGARIFVGPDIVENIFDFPNLLSVADITMISFTIANGVIGGLDYKSKYTERKKYEKDFRNAILEYKGFLEEEYPPKRRTSKN
jgi:hypothetical protein